MIRADSDPPTLQQQMEVDLYKKKTVPNSKNSIEHLQRLWQDSVEQSEPHNSIELKDEDDFLDDDCEFRSLEGNEEMEKSKHLPKIQKKFN